MAVTLMPHQEKALDELSNGKILHGGVGSGKSMTAMAYYDKNLRPKDIYVITTAKKRDHLDWDKEAAAFGISKKPEFSNGGTLQVDSWNNIPNYVDIEDAFFIFDEQRLVGYGAWVKAFLKIAKRNDWILLSATPGDTWLDYAPVFIANGLYKNITQFKYEHIVYAPFSKFPRIIRYMEVPTLERYRNMLLVEMPYVKHTSRLVQTVTTAFDEDLMEQAHKKRWHVFEDRPIKDVAELFRVMRRIVASDPSRIEEIRRLLTIHPKLIIFYNYDYELEILRGLVRDTEVAEWNGHRKQMIPKTDSWVYLVQYVSGAEGWNCVETDAMVFYSLTYSYKNFEQAQGRIDRLNTSFSTLFYYVFLSKNVADFSVWNAIKNKKLFNEKRFSEEFVGFEEGYFDEKPF